ncbi:MAG: aminotransferase class I/II-fold pyridoxal phosphate-dependent enzyme [Candidatus Symbiothrix sp.]|jgi:aspartate/methionine/tyrosine aminotransferase|nr:aminotransferase class I/II-fold pyridoxal phosphate-dependent enzyme [Candidatus Symbiothrix sp.]
MANNENTHLAKSPLGDLGVIPANRVNSVSEYYFSKKLKEVADMNAKGLDVINLGVGSPDLPPSEDAIETLCHSARQADSHGYQPYVGIPELRRAFAGWYKKWYRVDLNPDTEIQPLIGSKEGILHISLAFLNPGDGVLAPNPGYPTYSSVSNLVEARIIPYDLKEENDWQPDLEALEKLDLSNVKLMWVNYPNMPTGAPATKELYQKLVDFGRKHSIIICNDNPYSFILNENPISILEIEGAKDICIEMNSLSKSQNMPGWRMAMLASNPQFVQWILKVKSNIDSGQFKPMMLAAARALQAPKEWYSDMNKIYRKRRKMAEEIMKLLGCTFDPKQSGMFLWGKIPSRYESSEALADTILYNAHVFITPGFIFGSNGNNYIRISLCCKEEKLREALERIGCTVHGGKVQEKE